MLTHNQTRAVISQRLTCLPDASRLPSCGYHDDKYAFFGWPFCPCVMKNAWPHAMIARKLGDVGQI